MMVVPPSMVPDDEEEIDDEDIHGINLSFEIPSSSIAIILIGILYFIDIKSKVVECFSTDDVQEAMRRVEKYAKTDPWAARTFNSMQKLDPFIVQVIVSYWLMYHMRVKKV
jgi:hypothetical protein